ncbi:MAG TPA: RNA 2',3'-cyclic phosphodiesterase [Candidatus Sulfotelmatobacter sp.]|nr:RNA 2',3'-cyclic phosphodiesterase [Candidatus Sulfotelmatobacter sp.]
MRLFVAIEIEPVIRERINEFVSGLRPKISEARWVRPEGMHITLKFLGNVADERRTMVENALRCVCGREVTLSLKQLGVFPNPRSPRVLWAGIQAGPELEQLATAVDRQMGSIGFETEKRGFSPHVTLARFKDHPRGNLGSLLSEAQPSFGTMTANEFHLYESKLSPQGSRYIKLASFKLEQP